MKILSPITGTVKKLEEVNDEAFSQKLMGDGIAVVPSDGHVYAPVAGEVTMLFPTAHAIGLKTSEGVEVLLHIGIDTVEMNGDGFKAYVQPGDHVQVDDLLISMDLNKIAQAGYEADTMMIITNKGSYASMDIVQEGTIAHGMALLEMK